MRNQHIYIISVAEYHCSNKSPSSKSQQDSEISYARYEKWRDSLGMQDTAHWFEEVRVLELMLWTVSCDSSFFTYVSPAIYSSDIPDTMTILFENPHRPSLEI